MRYILGSVLTRRKETIPLDKNKSLWIRKFIFILTREIQMQCLLFISNVAESFAIYFGRKGWPFCWLSSWLLLVLSFIPQGMKIKKKLMLIFGTVNWSKQISFWQKMIAALLYRCMADSFALLLDAILKFSLYWWMHYAFGYILNTVFMNCSNLQCSMQFNFNLV